MKAKHLLFLLSFTVALPLSGQEDDMYFIPSKKKQQAQQPDLNIEMSVASPSRDVDEYNRRGKQQVVFTDTLGMQWTLQTDENGQSIWMPIENEEVVQDTKPEMQAYGEEDFSCTRRLGRFHSVYTPYYNYNSCYDPWFDPFYDPWLTSPWYRTSWYYGPYYGPYYGWGYGPGWYGPGFHPHYYHPVYVSGGRRGSSFGHVGGGALASGNRNSGVGTSRSGNVRRSTGVRSSSTARRAGTPSRSTGVSRSTSSSRSSQSVGTPSRSGSSRSSGATFSGGGSRGGGGRGR